MIEDVDGDARGPDSGDSATRLSRVRSVQRRSNGYVVLDSTWARRLGVRRSGGMYRIARRKLMDRLKERQQVPCRLIHISLNSTRQNHSSLTPCRISSRQASSPTMLPSW